MDVSTPKNISPKAQVFYTQVAPDLPLIDFKSSQQISMLREAFTLMWAALSEQTDYDYSFEEIEINGPVVINLMKPLWAHSYR